MSCFTLLPSLCVTEQVDSVAMTALWLSVADISLLLVSLSLPGVFRELSDLLRSLSPFGRVPWIRWRIRTERLWRTSAQWRRRRCADARTALKRQRQQGRTHREAATPPEEGADRADPVPTLAVCGFQFADARG